MTTTKTAESTSDAPEVTAEGPAPPATPDAPGTPAEPAAPAAPPKTRSVRGFLRVLRTFVVVAALVAGAVLGGTYIVDQRMAAKAFVELNGAVLTARPVLVGSADAGVVAQVLVAERDTVAAGQELARVTLTANGTSATPQTRVLRAPTAGTVSAVNVAVGGVARAGEPVVTLYDPAGLTFNVDVPLADLRKLRLGMTASITGPGLNRPITATLEHVVPRVGTEDPLSASDRLTVVLAPREADVARVRKLVPGLRFTATVDTKTAVGSTPAVTTG
jgi:multidrug resistance efflux pump